MPYIKQADRQVLDLTSRGGRIENSGELNYSITTLLIGFLGRSPNYAKINDAIGALEGAKLELYRRQAAPYEDSKIKENGDVYFVSTQPEQKVTTVPPFYGNTKSCPPGAMEFHYELKVHKGLGTVRETFSRHVSFIGMYVDLVRKYHTDPYTRIELVELFNKSYIGRMLSPLEVLNIFMDTGRFKKEHLQEFRKLSDLYPAIEEILA